MVCVLLSINRNILECKGRIDRNTEVVQQSINRNILECKVCEA